MQAAYEVTRRSEFLARFRLPLHISSSRAISGELEGNRQPHSFPKIPLALYYTTTLSDGKLSAENSCIQRHSQRSIYQDLSHSSITRWALAHFNLLLPDSLSTPGALMVITL